MNFAGPDNDIQNQAATNKLRKEIMRGKTKKVRSLLENNKVNINAKIRYTSNPDIAEYIALIWAAEKGYTEIVSLLLKQPDIDINIRDCQGFTALMCAAEKGKEKVVKLLLQQPKINVNIQNNKGATALMLAVNFEKKEVVKQLLNHPGIDISIKTRNGGTALKCAEIKGDREMKELLLGFSK
ncbi:ankyrin [Anaeromyces robustus]|uniref:Ankyrin n=1 Tax=Anaeromyces robustus TaxID=1754192 RepID=A0A1Y1WV47_9FUNG|nr:ankyrin [Anaeromyces robustus]|eukprot:ORX77431.1 ankyrin [Anaeromyces robustus]